MKFCEQFLKLLALPLCSAWSNCFWDRLERKVKQNCHCISWPEFVSVDLVWNTVKWFFFCRDISFSPSLSLSLSLSLMHMHLCTGIIILIIYFWIPGFPSRYVWNQEAAEWVPTLVILRLNRAALCVQWSPRGTEEEWFVELWFFFLILPEWWTI